MRDRKRKGMLTKRAISGVMALVMVLSAPAVWQGTITVYADEDQSEDPVESPTEEQNGNAETDFTATENTSSALQRTQIKNGDFEEIPWIDYVYNGVTYTCETYDKKLGSEITSSIPKGVDEGWNTTEIKPYQGNLFEVWPSNNPLDSKEDKNRFTQNGAQFIEMNTSNPACLYQDLATQGGDVIKWTLQHAARNNHGFNEQRMYVTIGSPEIGTNGEILAATGVGDVSGAEIVDNINTNIQNDAGKAEYRYNGITVGSGAAAFVQSVDDLSGLSVLKTDTDWHTVTGIYVVPQGQDVTRFAFCADALSKTASDDIKHLSGGNFLDNITFSTLIGKLTATKQDGGDVKVTGYWGDTDTSKRLVVDLGDDNLKYVDMKDVCEKNFEITVPADMISSAGAVKVYHEDYVTATKTVPITHAHDWNYESGSIESGDANKIYAYCAENEEEASSGTHDCLYKQAEKNVFMTLTAPDAVYTGNAYKEARVSDWSIPCNGLAMKPAITYYCLDDNNEETITNVENGGAASEGAAPKNAGCYRAKITITDGTGSATLATATKDFTISPLTIDKVAFTEPTTTPGSSQASSLKTADNAYYTGTISWAPSEGKFGYNKSYTATVTLTLKDSVNCEFANPATCADNGWNVQSPSGDGTLKLTKNYTTAKAKITSVTEPNVTTQLTEFTTEAAQIAVLPTTVAAVVEDNSKTSMAITWQLKTATVYSEASGAENTFVWTVNSDEYANYDTNDQTLTGEVTIKNPAHTHDWSYDAQGNQLTAYCTKGGTQGCTYDIAHKLTLTLTTVDMIYSGNVYTGAAISDTEQNAWTEAGLVVPTIQYEGTSGTSYDISSTAPTAVGNYKAVISIGGQNAEATFKITSSGGGSGSGGDSGGGNQPGPGSSSGSGTTPTTPSEPVAPTENFEIPVKNENTVKVEAEIKSGTANVSEITTKTIENVVNSKDAQSKVDTITIDLSGAKQEVTGVTLSKESVKTLAETTAQKDNGIETATIELSKATVELDQKTLETLVEQARGEQIELVVADKDQKKLNSAQQTSLSQCQVATTFEAYFTSGGQRIHDFKGGKAVVSIDFTPEAGKDTSFYHLVYVADHGEMTRYKTKYEKRKLMFTTTHFSDYAVIYDITEKNETDEQQEEEKGETEADSSDTDRSVTMDTTYAKLRLRVPKSTKTANLLKWNKVADADGYVIYGNLCNTKGKTYQQKVLVTIRDNATTAWIDKNLATGVYYKYSIKAYKLIDGKKVWIAKSKVVHSTTAGGKYGNATSVKVNKTAVTLEVGKTFTIKAEQIVKDLPIKKHVVIKYESSNSKVASVTGKGVIKAKKKGSCYIYVYAQNGMYQRVKVTVK